MFDVTNEASFLSIRNWLTCIDNYVLTESNLRPPILLVGNKIDLTTHRKIDSNCGKELADELGITYIEVCAVTGVNVQHTLDVLIEKIFQFMDDSMEKYYRKQTVQTIVTNQNFHQRKASVKLMKKLSNVQKTACSCNVNRL